MNALTLTRCLAWLLIAVCPPLLGQCGGATEHSTESGNPPLVEEQKLHIELRNSGVEVLGGVGAVSPGASVRVTNRTTGEIAKATASDDGSVSVLVPGSLEDEYELTVSNGTGSQTVQIPAQPSGGAAGAGGMAGSSDTANTGSTGGSSSYDYVLCDSLERQL